MAADHTLHRKNIIVSLILREEKEERKQKSDSESQILKNNEFKYLVHNVHLSIEYMIQDTKY